MSLRIELDQLRFDGWTGWSSVSLSINSGQAGGHRAYALCVEDQSRCGGNLLGSPPAQRMTLSDRINRLIDIRRSDRA